MFFKCLNTGNRVGDEGYEALAEGLLCNQFLASADLSYNPVSVDGCKALAEGLKCNYTLTSIDLSGACIDDEGCTALAEGLKENTALALINLAGTLSLLLLQYWVFCYPLPACLQHVHLCACVSSSSYTPGADVFRLHGANNAVGADGCRALAETLKCNKSLTSIGLYGEL